MSALIIIALAATLSVLIGGVVLMAVGGPFNQRYGRKLMVLRVVCQALSIALVGILMVVMKGQGT